MTAKEVDKLTFEEALAELEKTVRALETGSAGLKESIEFYERGVALKKHCEVRLKEAQMRVEKISIASDGGIAVEPFKVSE